MITAIEPHYQNEKALIDAEKWSILLKTFKDSPEGFAQLPSVS